MTLKNTDQRLRIALVPPLWARVATSTAGGVEYVVCLLADELVRRGHDVTVFTSRDSTTAAGIEALCEWNFMEGIRRDVVKEYNYYEACNIAEALQKSASFDVLHFHLGCQAIPFSVLSRARVLHTLHNPVTPDPIWLLERYPNVPVTSVSRQQIAAIPAERRRSIRVIHNACNFDAYEFSALPDKYLAFLGRMGAGKSPLEAIHIAREGGLPIVLAGQALNNKERAYFTEKIEPLIDGRNVIHIGPVDHREKNAFLKQASALLFPIEAEEAFGMVMIEAMACGTPVLAFRRSAVEEVVDVGKTGFYADSVQELASLIPRALALDRRVVREHARQRFNHLRMVDEYLQSYEAILNGNWDRHAALGTDEGCSWETTGSAGRAIP